MKILKFGLLFLLGIVISRDLSALTISLPYDTEGSVPIRKDLNVDYLGRVEKLSLTPIGNAYTDFKEKT